MSQIGQLQIYIQCYSIAYTRKAYRSVRCSLYEPASITVSIRSQSIACSYGYCFTAFAISHSISSARFAMIALLVSPLSIAFMLPAIQPTSQSNQLVLSLTSLSLRRRLSHSLFSTLHPLFRLFRLLSCPFYLFCWPGHNLSSLFCPRSLLSTYSLLQSKSWRWRYQKSEKKETVYNEMVYDKTECFESVVKVFTKVQAPFSGLSTKSSTYSSAHLFIYFSTTFSIFILLARIYIGFLHASSVMRCSCQYVLYRARTASFS